MQNKHLKLSAEDKIFRIISLTFLTIIMIVIIYPLVFVLFASFSDPFRVYESPLLLFPKGFCIESYKLVFEYKDIWIGYRNSLMYTILGTTVNVIMTSLGAYPLSRKDFAGRGVLTVFYVFTMFFNGGLIPSYLVIHKLGLPNTIGVMIIPMAVGVYNMIIMRTYFQQRIPPSLEDAAKIDGCTNFALFRKVVLPLSKPIIAVMALFYGVGHWNSYFHGMIYLSNRELYPLQLFLRELLVQNSMENMMQTIVVDEQYATRMVARMGLKYAVIVAATLPIFILYPFLQRFFKTGIMVGAIKG